MHDIILLADDPQTLINHINQRVASFKSLAMGFTLHGEKSQLVPSQKVTFLGFILDSVTMTVPMKSDKAEKVKTAICQLLKKERPLVREVASVVGVMISCFPGVKYAPLYYRSLENDKTDVLKQNGWNHDAHMHIYEQAKRDLTWWLNHVYNNPCPVMPPEPKLTLKCDSSLEG